MAGGIGVGFDGGGLPHLIAALIWGLGMVLVVAQVALFAAAFAVAPASEAVEGLAGQYLSIRIWGAPATIAPYALTGWLVGLGRTRGVLALQLWQNGINVVLDLWFVLGLGWGVPGVAGSTLIAEWSGLAFALWLLAQACSLQDQHIMHHFYSASALLRAHPLGSAGTLQQTQFR